VHAAVRNDITPSRLGLFIVRLLTTTESSLLTLVVVSLVISIVVVYFDSNFAMVRKCEREGRGERELLVIFPERGLNNLDLLVHLSPISDSQVPPFNKTKNSNQKQDPTFIS
jgi:hypothetical protein